MTDPATWLAVPQNLALVPGEVHVWRVPLSVSSHIIARLSSYLDAEETLRANRFLLAQHREHFLVSRAALRVLLGRYLNFSPELVTIAKGPQGKPFLPQSANETALRFNLSHSHGLALFAFACDRELGIDLEKLRPDFASAEIAARYFSSNEQREWNRLPESLRTEGFFNAWTRKEAYVKAKGEGLLIPLDSFDVTLTPGAGAHLRSADSKDWSLMPFSPNPEFVAAIVVQGGAPQFRFLDGASLF